MGRGCVAIVDSENNFRIKNLNDHFIQIQPRNSHNCKLKKKRPSTQLTLTFSITNSFIYSATVKTASMPSSKTTKLSSNPRKALSTSGKSATPITVAKQKHPILTFSPIMPSRMKLHNTLWKMLSIDLLTNIK